MLLNFRQGIIFGSRFASVTSRGVDLTIRHSPLCISFARGDKNYTWYETVDVINAWTLPTTTACWLYIDINVKTANRTFGYCTTSPTFGPTAPVSVKAGDHWFDTQTNQMKYYTELPVSPSQHSRFLPAPGYWTPVIRMFVATVSSSRTVIEYSTGSQVDTIHSSNIYSSGSIVYDRAGRVITDQNDNFVTTDVVSTVSSRSIIGISDTNLAIGTIVKWENGKIVRASYFDVNQTLIGILITDALIKKPTYVTINGLVRCSLWNWQVPVGSRLWIDDNGLLTHINPHANDYQYALRNQVAFVVDTDQVYFTQQTKSAKTDSRNIADDHIHLAQDILVYPTVVDMNNIQTILQSFDSSKLELTGGTMTGPLWVVDSEDPSSAVTKMYVDSTTLSDLDDVSVFNELPGQQLTINEDLETWGNTDQILSQYQHVTLQVTQEVLDQGVFFDLIDQNMLILNVSDNVELMGYDPVFLNGRIGTKLNVTFGNISPLKSFAFDIVVHHQSQLWLLYAFSENIEWRDNLSPPSGLIYQDATLVMSFKSVAGNNDSIVIVGHWDWHFDIIPRVVSTNDNINIQSVTCDGWVLRDSVSNINLAEETITLSFDPPSSYVFHDINKSTNVTEEITLNTIGITNAFLASFVVSQLYPYAFYDEVSGRSASYQPDTVAEAVGVVNSESVATVTHTNHGMNTGDFVVVAGANLTQNNGMFQITYVNPNTYTYRMSNSPGANPTGTITSTFASSGTKRNVSIANSSTVATVTDGAHGINKFARMFILGSSDSRNNGLFPIRVTSVDGYEYSINSGSAGTPSGDISETASVTIANTIGVTKKATVTYNNHRLKVGDQVTIVGAVSTPANINNGTFTVATTAINTFTYTLSTAATSVTVTGDPITGKSITCTVNNRIKATLITDDVIPVQGVTIVNSGTLATVTHNLHNLQNGADVLVSGSDMSQNNGIFSISVVNPNVYTYVMASSPSANPSALSLITVYTIKNRSPFTIQQLGTPFDEILGRATGIESITLVSDTFYPIYTQPTEEPPIGFSAVGINSFSVIDDVTFATHTQPTEEPPMGFSVVGINSFSVTTTIQFYNAWQPSNEEILARAVEINSITLT